MNNQTFVTKLLSIKDIVSNNLFKVPDYQRGYSWGKDQVEDLIKDIEHIAHKEHNHYTGTLVVSITSNEDRFHIVDGQQRFTTLIILLREIYELDKVKFSSIYNTFLIRENGDYVLETNKENNIYFKEAVIGDKRNLTANIKSLQNLQLSKETLAKWLKKEETNIDVIYDAVIKKLGFLCFAPEDTKEIGIMFEVINNRGKELSELEKIKNYFIYYATIHNNTLLHSKVNNNWGQILRDLSEAGVVSNQDENNYLRNCYIVFYSANKQKSWYSYEELKKRYRPDDIGDLEGQIGEMMKFIDFMQEAAQYYAYFFKGVAFDRKYDKSYKDEIAYVLRQLRCHPVNASIFPLYLAAMSYLYEWPSKTLRVLEAIEKTNFRVYVLPNAKISRSDSKQGNLFSWARELYKDRNWSSEDDEYEYYTNKKRLISGDIFDYILMHLQDFTEVMCPESVFVQSLTVDEDESIDYYYWAGLRYFLAAYEEQRNAERKETWNIEKILISRDETKKNKLNDYLSREHIWASKNRRDDFPEDHIDKRRLGNFVLIGLRSNIQLSKDDIIEKIKFLIDHALISLIQVNELKEMLSEAVSFAGSRRKKRTKHYFKEIATFLIDNRENELIKFALKRWKFDSEEMDKFINVDSFKSWELGKNERYFLERTENPI